MQKVSTDADVCACMLCGVRCVSLVFSPTCDRAVDAVGGTGHGALREDPEVSRASWLCSDCSLYPSQSHLQLKRGPVREKETAKEEEERKRDKAIETESRSRECIYTWVMDLLRDDFFVLGGG